ncbi:hypothetical protein GCM10009789_60080 [Kribbella sancticallisti]|uniref:Uncharacterized protein n=1 Tax=Kribbella sancticallisti TaxID=460087 RepID=A0ABN2E6K0_9ACTN
MRLFSVIDKGVPTVPDQPTEPMPGLPDEQVPDPNLRAARAEIRAVGASLRQALAKDDELAGRKDTPR